MKYFKTQNVLPEEIIKIIQGYIDGGYIYIPKKNANHKSWGEGNGAKNRFIKRDSEIFNKYIEGITILQLAEQYYLSEQSIRRIINKGKMTFSTSKQNHL